MPENNTQVTTSEAKLLTDDRFLRRIAYAYYEDGHSQETIAEMEYCSRQTISKALQKAKDRGIVRISIIPDLRTGYLRNLSRDVRLQLNLEDLILVTGRNMNVVAADETVDEVVKEIASSAGDYLDQMLTDSDIVAVSGGKTFMRNIVRYLKPSKILPHMQVVPTIGFVDAHTNYGDANMIAHDLADAYGASHLWFPCPAFLPDRDQVQRIRQYPIIRDAYDRMTRANILVTSLWTASNFDDMVMQGVLTQEQLEMLAAQRPVVDINHWIFDASGRCINETVEPFPYFLSGLEVPQLKERIRKSNLKVMLVAGGSPTYVPAIRSVLHAGLANILVTDHITAQLLLTGD